MLSSDLELPPVPLQSLSELERFRLQEIALYRLREYGGFFDITPDSKTRKPVRRRPERKDAPSGLFGIPLPDVIAHDRVEKQRVSAVRSRRGCAEVESTVLTFRVHSQRRAPRGPSLEMPLSPNLKKSMSHPKRRGGLSVDSITELDDSDERLLEALQLSHPTELQSRKEQRSPWLSLNPIYKQVPRVVERCCSHIETYGIRTVGIFRIGSSKKRVEQLREEFAATGDVFLGEETCVHDVSALLKGFLRELPDPVLPCELYQAFIHTAGLDPPSRLRALQLLIFAIPPCNSDTLLRILQLLHKVALHAEDTIVSTTEKVPGNKMTAANLATVFGPNLLHNEVEMQCVQDSASQIRVTETLIQHHQELYMVPSNLQSDILISLMEMDPEVTDCLLRRKFSGARVSIESLSLGMDLECPLLPHRPLETLLQLLSSGGTSGFPGSSRLSHRRPSRSQENLSILTANPPPRAHLLPRPRFLPLFTRSASSSPQASPCTPSPVTSHSHTPFITPDGIRKWKGLSEPEEQLFA
ncbi:rho GTPase-activating protein 36 [Discoglossus pictus]